MKEEAAAADGAPHFLIHREGDHVGVAVRDVEPGRRRAVYMDSDRQVEVEVIEAVPLGHKIALSDLPEGSDVVEYGVRVARCRSQIRRGELVHVHNVGSVRWQRGR